MVRRQVGGNYGGKTRNRADPVGQQVTTFKQNVHDDDLFHASKWPVEWGKVKSNAMAEQGSA